MAYQSLYRKYRPQRFSELVGQEHVTTALRNAVRDDRVGHAYLFSGPRGTGKTSTARLLAKALNCLNRGDDGDPCGVCAHCEEIANGTFLDLFELDAASNRGVNDARDLLERIAFRSATGGKKVYILDEVHMLTDAAANTLLKSLEEPPDHVVFVLATTNPEQVLPTIRSRAQHFEFSLLPTEQIAAYLADICAREGIEADPEALAVVARGGAGSMRDALSLLDQALAHATGRLDATEVGSLLGGAPFEMRAQILQAIADGDPATVLVELGALLESGHEPRRVGEDLLRAARDAFLLTAGAGRVAVEGTDEERAALEVLGSALGTPTVVRVIETLGQAIVDMRGVDAADPRLVLEVALVRLSRREAGPPMVMLEERVSRLESALAGGAAPASPRATPAPAASAARAVPAAPAVTAAAPAAPVEPVAPANKPAPKRALGGVRSERAARAVDAPPAAPEPDPTPVTAPEPVATPSSGGPLDLDDVVLAWATVLPDLPMATRAQVQHAQPIRIEGDVVVFGVAPQAHAATKKRFHDARDSIRDALAQHLGQRPKFQLEASDLVDLAGGSGGGGAVVVANEEPPPPPDEEPPPEQLEAESYDVGEFMDAEPAGPAVSSVGLLEAEFGATVVEERPRQ